MPQRIIMKKLITFRVEGGLGKHIVFTSLLKPLFEKYGKFNMISSYDDVFAESEYVENSWGAEAFDGNSEEFKGSVSKIVFHEPYKTGFNFSDAHIKYSWGNAFGVIPEELPSIETTKEVLDNAKAHIEAIGKKYFVIQMSGGQPPLGFTEDSQYHMSFMQQLRNYPLPMSSILVQKIHNAFPDHEIIDFTLPNEPTVDGAARFVLPYTGYTEVCKHAEDIICIDSSLAHIAASVNKSAIVLWNTAAEATPKRYGWSVHTNIVAPNMAIDYDYIVDELIRRNK